MSDTTREKLTNRLSDYTYISSWQTPDGKQSGKVVPLEFVLELYQSEITKAQKQLLDDITIQMALFTHSTEQAWSQLSRFIADNRKELRKDNK